MDTFYIEAENRPARGPEKKVPLVQALIVIAGLSALCWALVVAAVLGLRALI
jgi:hypothetical protein